MFYKNPEQLVRSCILPDSPRADVKDAKEMARIVQELNSMLESAQQVAWKAQNEKLALEDEVDELRRRMVGWFVSWAIESTSQLSLPERRAHTLTECMVF